MHMQPQLLNFYSLKKMNKNLKAQGISITWRKSKEINYSITIEGMQYGYKYACGGNKSLSKTNKEIIGTDQKVKFIWE